MKEQTQRLHLSSVINTGIKLPYIKMMADAAMRPQEGIVSWFTALVQIKICGQQMGGLYVFHRYSCFPEDES